LIFIKTILKGIKGSNSTSCELEDFASLDEIENVFGNAKKDLFFLRQGLSLRYFSLLTAQLRTFPDAENAEQFLINCTAFSVNSEYQKSLTETYNYLYMFDSLVDKYSITKISDFKNISSEQMDIYNLF